MFYNVEVREIVRILWCFLDSYRSMRVTESIGAGSL